MAITVNGVESALGWAGPSPGSVVAAVTFGGTLQSNAVLILAVSLNSTTTTPVTVTSVTDASGNTWSKITSQEKAVWDTTNMLVASNISNNLELWYTRAASVNTTLNITINYTGGTLDTGIWAISPKLLGVNATRPFDLNPSVPAYGYIHSVTASNPAITPVSTNTANMYPIACHSDPGGGAAGNWNFNGSLRDMQANTTINGTQANRITFAGKSGLSAAYSAVSFSYSSAVHNSNDIGIVLTADGQTPSISRAVFVG